MALDV
jgi:toxin HigB-1